MRGAQHIMANTRRLGNTRNREHKLNQQCELFLRRYQNPVCVYIANLFIIKKWRRINENRVYIRQQTNENEKKSHSI